MSQILLVEDDPILGRTLSVNFRAEGYGVTWERDLRGAFRAEKDKPFDLVVLDRELPDGVGLDLCRYLRSRGSRLPVLVLTARADEDSVVEGLYAGANDYVRKPFGNRELLARVRVALNEPMQRAEQMRFGELLLLTEQRRAFWRQHELELNRREYDILTALIRQAGHVVSRESLLENFGGEADIFDRTIDSHVSHLRAKFRKAGVSTIRIASVYGVGYRLEQE